MKKSNDDFTLQTKVFGEFFSTELKRQVAAGFYTQKELQRDCHMGSKVIPALKGGIASFH